MIYIAAPYSDPDPLVVKKRMASFIEATADFIEADKHPVSPLMNHLLTDYTVVKFPLTWDYWKEYSLKLLSVCDRMIVLTLPGWEDSAGVTAEIALAHELNIPITYIGDY